MKTDVVKNELVKKVNTIQTNYNSDLVKKKVDYDTKTEDIEKKITINDNYINTDEFNK